MLTKVPLNIRLSKEHFLTLNQFTKYIPAVFVYIDPKLLKVAKRVIYVPPIFSSEILAKKETIVINKTVLTILSIMVMME